MTSAQHPNQSTHGLRLDEVTFELVQTTQGDWIIPTLNGLHFGASNSTTPLNGDSFAQHVLRNHFGQKLHQEDCLFVIVGSDSGQLIRFVQAQTPLPRGARWVFIEPQPIARVLWQNAEIAALLDDYVHLITPDQWEETAQLLLLDDYFRINGVVFERSLAALDHTTTAYLALAGELDAELSRRRYITTANLGKLPFIQAQLGNIPNFHAHLVPLKNIFQGKKALILAGGPSLDLEIDWIKAHRNRLFLIAVSRISARLLTAGIHPDMVATVDPHPISLTVSRQMFDFSSHTILVASNHAYPGIVNRWPHKVLHTDSLLPWHEDADENNPANSLNPQGNAVSVGPTVTHTCVMLAAYLGFTEIAFAGLDLCHSPEGQTHASGSSEAASGPLLDYTAIKVTNNNGDIAWTTPDYFSGIGAMENLAAYLAPQGVRLFNPSRQGAVINGVTFQPLADMSWPAEAFDRTALDTQLSHTAEETLAHIKQVRASVHRIQNDLGKIEHLAQLALESNRAFFNMISPARQAIHQRRMRAIDRFMRSRLPDAEQLVKAIAQHELLATDLPHDFFALGANQAENLTHRFFDAIRRGAILLQTLFPKLDYRLNTRALEQNPQILPDELLSRYEEGGEPERALWLKINRQLPSSITAKTEAIYQQKIQILMAEDQTRNTAKRAPRASLRLAEMHFSHRNLHALQALEHALEHHPDKAQAEPYKSYLSGLIAEINAQPEIALLAYESVLNQAHHEEDKTLLEHCLLRIASASLTLHNTEQANQALDTAALLNPSHWPLSARLAELRQDHAHAINAYTHYLALFPGDHQRIRLLANLLKQMKLEEGIQQCIQLIDYCAVDDQADLRGALMAILADLKTS
jgi:hypothetical protein